MSRERLPNRRQAESFEITHAGISYVASVSRYRDGRLAEIFLSATKAGSYSDALARDAAIVASLALQGGVPAESIRHALGREADGRASTPLCAALDDLAKRGAL
jgi:ribonucleoside-diphosphate reductase alpha chain